MNRTLRRGPNGRFIRARARSFSMSNSSPDLRALARHYQSTAVTVAEYDSAYTGAPCVAILMFHGNAKTGPLAQLWFIPAAYVAGEHPFARQADVCGGCAQRPDKHGGCYVTPMSVASVRKTTYPYAGIGALHRAREAEVPIRIGAWGDVGSVPVGHPLLAVLADYPARVGYTHAWRRRPDLRGMVMASTERARDYHRAIAAGWSAFGAHADVAGTCPTETDESANCAECMACHGTGPSPTIAVHGYLSGRARLRVLG